MRMGWNYLFHSEKICLSKSFLPVQGTVPMFGLHTHPEEGTDVG